MTLHEAIERVLQDNGKPMTTSEIAEIINNNRLYMRRDNLPIQATQIAARVGNYPNLFTRDNGKIKLVKNDPATLLFQNVRNKLVHNFYEYTYSNKLLPLELLEKSINDLLGIKQNDNQVNEPSTVYSKTKRESFEKLDAIFKLCHWYFLQESNSRKNNFIIFNEGFISLLAGIDFFKEHNNTIITNTSVVEYFLLKILSDNKEAEFNILKNSSQNFVSKEVIQFNNYLIDLYKNHFVKENQNNYKNLKTEIIIPPLGLRQHDPIIDEFTEIIEEINTKQKKLDKAILLVPISTLSSLRRNYINARKTIIDTNFLDIIVELPPGVIENTGVKLALLFFDFNRKPDAKIYFLDVSNLPLSELYSVSDSINKKSIINEFSVEVDKKNINSNNYSLLPTIYISKANEVEEKENHTVYTLGQILLDKKTGASLNYKKSNFYSGGEYKLIRNSDLNKNTVYFTPTIDAIGIDNDQLAIEKLNLISGGLVISSINQNVKSNVLPENEYFILGNYIHWLKPNPNIVSDEFLAKELLQPYVLNQFDLYTSGSTYMPILKLNDLLKIKIQLPSLDTQRELLLNELRNNENVTKKSDAISERELDFVKTLKHSLKQPTAGLSNDFASLKHFLNTKINLKEILSNEETIVPIFDEDTPETIERFTLQSTLARMERSLSDIDYILEQAIKLITIAKPIKKEVDLKGILTQIKSEYKNVNFKISGGKTILLADESQLKIVLHNLIDNALKHGFKDEKITPTIWLEILKKGNDFIELSVRNNGKPLPPEFTIDDFLAKGKSSKADVGSGFGGFLVGQIIKNHKGKIILNNNVGNEILPHNVEFIISLPR